MDSRPKTIFCDIDGVLLKHIGDITNLTSIEPSILPGVKSKILKWESKGYNIILVTGRKESLRQFTENQLLNFGIYFDKLIMGIGGGVRVIINDKKENSNDDTAFAIVLNRNEGLSNIDI